MLVQSFLILLLAATSLQLHAQAKKRKTVDLSKIIYVNYGSQSWNTDSTKIDTASLVLRDKSTGKIVQIQLEETEPDSSQFIGRFSLSLGEQQQIAPEVFIPPKELRGTDKDNKKLFGLVQSGKLPRKPLIWKKNERGNPVIDVYDTRDQAEAALRAYEAEEKAAAELRKKKPGIPMSTEAAMAAAKAAERKTQLDKLALEGAQREAERLRLEQIERQKVLEREERARKMSEQEKAERKAKAEVLNTEALAAYNQSDYATAEAKFKQTLDLDPDNKAYYYKYGITLYRNKKYNEALVALKLANVTADKELEKKFYMGLVYYRLAELDNALKQFNEVGAAKDPEMGPSALFYAGVVQFTQEKYDPAKKNFENVIDTSKDPKLDEQAEQYLDRIASALAFQKLRENKFTVAFTVGPMYDSNVLLSPDTLPGGGKPSNTGDFRLLTLLDLQYRPLFNEHYELAPHVTANLTNSVKNSNAQGDPFIYDLASPFTFKAKKGNRYTVTPGYEWLYMDPTNTGTKSIEMASPFLAFDGTFIMSQTWISTYTFEYRFDKSSDPSSLGENNLDSNKFTLRTTQLMFLDKNRKKMLIPAGGYIMNNAKGAAKTYNRFDLGITYVQPTVWNMGWNIGLNYYNQKYKSATPSRTDNDYTLTTGVSKPIRDWVTWGLTGSYTKNGSSDSSYTYSKYLIMTTATFSTNF